MIFTVTNGEPTIFPIKVNVTDKGLLGKPHMEGSKGYNDLRNRNGIININLDFDYDQGLLVEVIAPEHDLVSKMNENLKRKRIREGNLMDITENINKTGLSGNSIANEKSVARSSEYKYKRFKESILSISQQILVSPIRNEESNENRIEEQRSEKNNSSLSSNNSLTSSDDTSSSSIITSGSSSSDITKTVSDVESNMDVDGLPKVTQEEIENFKFSVKRIMCKKIGLSDVENVNINFFENSKRVIEVKIGKMCHAQRYWLATKFFILSQENKLNMSQNKIGELFGISRAAIWKFLKKNKIGNMREMIEKFGYMSPAEFNPRFHFKYIKDMASNFEEIKSIFKRN